MPGNEIEVAKFIFRGIGKLSLGPIGLVQNLGFPYGGGFQEVRTLADIGRISPDDAEKKADIFINGKGVSIKQEGGSFSFNRLQRKNLLDLFSYLDFGDPEACLRGLDIGVSQFHLGQYDSRNRPWHEFFREGEFKKLMSYLMMEGSPNRGRSSSPADYILEAPASGYSASNIRLYTFEEYFGRYREKFFVAIRRGWVGQKSKSEHTRALSISGNSKNSKWVFDTISGEPKGGWRVDFPAEKRRTVYYLMIEKVR